MRQLVVSVPAEFEADIIEALQETCRLKNITRSTDGDISRITCFVAAQEAGIVLHELDKVGCGAAYGKVAMLPVQLLKPLPNVRDRHRHLTSLVAKSTWRLKGRMATEEIHTNVASGAALSFDYLAFVVVAGLIAAVGLATNSTVMIVASMLVSPLMGPILAFAFGTSVRDPYLIWRGVVAEAVGVTLTFLVGFVVGLAVCIWTGVARGYGWPTAEMESRGQVSGLVVGVFFAVPSGAGVALSTTQGGTTALVGVAIAASLLPPVVNCGMCLAFAAAGARRIDASAARFFRISWMSLALFLINVGCIYSVCILFFYIKGIRKVRKQLSRYRELPPLRVNKVKEPTGSSGALTAARPGPKHATTAPGTLAGYDSGPAAGSDAGGGGGSGGGGTCSRQAVAATAAAAAAAAAAASPVGNGGTAAGSAEVVIKVGSPSALETAGGPSSAPGSRHGSTGAVGASARRPSGGWLMDNLRRLAGSADSWGLRSAAGSGTSGGGGGGAAAAAAGPPAARGPSLRGWRKVRKVVLEDKALRRVAEPGGNGEGDEEDARSPRVHNI